jgi:hypothetical protein
MSDWDPLCVPIRDRRLEAAARIGDGVAVESDDVHAPPLIELQARRLLFVVISQSRRQPESIAASRTASSSARPIPWPSRRLRIVTSSHSSPRTAYETRPARSPFKKAMKPGSRVGSTSSPKRATTGSPQLSVSISTAHGRSSSVSGRTSIIASSRSRAGSSRRGSRAAPHASAETKLLSQGERVPHDKGAGKHSVAVGASRGARYRVG